MQKLSVEETSKLVFKRGVTQEIVIEANKLEVGEALVVGPNDWPMKTKIGNYLGQTFRKERSDKKFSIKKLADGFYAVIRKQ
jgi:hypothetical protein